MRYNGDYSPRKGGFRIMPVGDYELVISDCQESVSKKSGNQMWRLTMNPSDSQYSNHNLWYYIVDNDYFQTNVGNLLSAIGENPYEARDLTPEYFIGKYLNAHIIHEEYKGNMQAKIHFLIENYETQEQVAPLNHVVEMAQPRTAPEAPTQPNTKEQDDEIPF